MENPPPTIGTPEAGEPKESKDSKDTKKTKSAEALGAMLIEPKNEKVVDDKKPSMLEQLTGIKDVEKPKDDQSEAAPEALTETLSDDERQFVEEKIVREAPELESTADPEVAAGDAAVESFRDKIIEGQDSDTAFTETLEEIEEPTPEEPAAEAPFEEAIIDLQHEEDTAEPVVLGGVPPVPPRPPRRPESRPDDEPDDDKPKGPRLTDWHRPGAFASGVIVGEILGRRSGKQKAERVQKKLEREVVVLKNEIVRKEEIIRKAAVEKVRAEQPERPLATPEKPKKLPLEQIGKVVVDAETVTIPTRERPQPAKRPAALEGLTERDIVTLNRQELLAVSEKIIVESTSLRDVYETKLIGEKGLRRLVAEYLRGGNLDKALKRELIEKEIDFERDPQLRDRDHGATDGGGTHLEALLKKVDNLPGGSSGEMAVLKARAAHEAAEQRKQKQRRKVADISLAATIAVLLAAIILLLLER